MGDYTKITGVEDHDIVKVVGVSSHDIIKVVGATKGGGGNGATATKWLIGGSNGKVYKTAQANAGSGWSEIVDLGGGTGKGITIGEDASGNKRWVLHRSATSEEIAYVSDGQEGNSVDWTEVNLSNNHVAVNGGPSLAWGNDFWIGAGDDIENDPPTEIVLFASSNGGSTWSSIQIPGQQTNDTGRAAAYKDSTTFFMTVQDQIWKATSDPTNANNWSLAVDLAGAQDITCMAYNGADRWVCGGQNGEIHTSDDDWSTATSRTGGHGTSDVNGVVFCAGTVNKWVTVGASGKIAYSSDGITWTSISPNVTAQHFRAVATDNTTIVAVGASGTVFTSADAINWNEVTHDPVISQGFWSIACDVIGSGMR